MYETCKKGLDLRSPDHQLTFRNRVAKELQRLSGKDVRAEAAKVTGCATASLTRQQAIDVIVRCQLHALRAPVAA